MRLEFTSKSHLKMRKGAVGNLQLFSYLYCKKYIFVVQPRESTLTFRINMV